MRRSVKRYINAVHYYYSDYILTVSCITFSSLPLSLYPAQVPDINPNARLLQPPPPIALSEDNWPLLTQSKGFFDNYNTRGGTASAMAADVGAEDGDGEGGWGDDAELVLDGKKQWVVMRVGRITRGWGIYWGLDGFCDGCRCRG